MNPTPSNPLTLDGTTIRLIPLSLTHLDDLCSVGLNPQLWSATIIRVTTRLGMEAYIRAALDAQQAGTAIPFAIQHRHTQAILGSTRFHSIASQDRCMEIGFTWVAIPWQRSRVNAEAKYLLLRHAFECMGCLRVEFRADAENEQSAERCCASGRHRKLCFGAIVYRHIAACGISPFSVLSRANGRRFA